MSTTEVVEVLQDPGGGLDVPKPLSPWVPLAVAGALFVAVVVFGKKGRHSR